MRRQNNLMCYVILYIGEVICTRGNTVDTIVFSPIVTNKTIYVLYREVYRVTMERDVGVCKSS